MHATQASPAAIPQQQQPQQQQQQQQQQAPVSAAGYQVSESRKEEFRKYLEKNGIVDALTNVLVTLYEEPEKPDNPLEFMRSFLVGPSDVDTEAQKAEISDLKRQVDELKAKLEIANRMLAEHAAPNSANNNQANNSNITAAASFDSTAQIENTSGNNNNNTNNSNNNGSLPIE